MNAVKFPNMFTSNKTALVKDKDATYQNLRLLLLSSKYTLFGDPHFGSNLKRLFFEHNNVILRDLVIDDIFTVITTYMPQVRVTRENIGVEMDTNSVNITIRAQNLLDFSFSEYTINLLNMEEMWRGI